jgi:hypothetical protein
MCHSIEPSQKIMVYIIIIIIIIIKEFEQCRFDTVPLPAARPTEIKGAELRQSRPMADQPQHDLLPRCTSKRDQLLSPL